MTTNADEAAISSNKEFLKSLRGPVARFYPIDLHVHSLGSYDVCQGDRHERLPSTLQAVAPIVKSPPNDPGEYDKQFATSANVQVFFDALCEQRDSIAQNQGLGESDRWAIVGITDHNTSHFSTALSLHAWNNRTSKHLVVLPGIELEVHFSFPECDDPCKVHILLLFAPCTESSSIRMAINTAAGKPTPAWNFGDSHLQVSDLPEFIQSLREASNDPAICIAAHVGSAKGIENEPKQRFLSSLDADIARAEGELTRAQGKPAASEVIELKERLRELQERRDDDESLHLDVLTLIGNCGFDALQIRDQSHEQHYRRLHRFRENSGRAVPLVSSDAHSTQDVFLCEGSTPYAKLSILPGKSAAEDIFTELRDQVLRFGETRLTYSAPGAVSHWIEGLEVTPDNDDSRTFWKTDDATPFRLAFSRNLNCLIGGRGSGKSAAIEALAFVCSPQQFVVQGNANNKDHEEWYRRAKATLAGCKVRIVWKSTAPDGIGSLKKRALFVSRYFDPDGNHQTVECRDIESNPITDGTQQPLVRLLRAHDIERTAEASQLRNLFDELCGSEKKALDSDIRNLQQELRTQRQEVVDIIEELEVLTVDNGALRQYGIRMLLFEEIDRKEHRAKYAKADKASMAHCEVQSIRKEWGELKVTPQTQILLDAVVAFFDRANTRLTDDSGKAKAGLEELLTFIGSSPQENTTLRQKVETALKSVLEQDSAMSSGIEALNDSVKQQLEAIKSELEREGLPAGSGAREAKRVAFEEAKQALEAYEAKTENLGSLLTQRQKKVTELNVACSNRSDIRSKVACNLTKQLDKDLDSTVLRIEIDSRSKADQEELRTWLEQHVEPKLQRHKSVRLSALLEKPLDYAELRKALWEVDGNNGASLVINASRQEQGRINKVESKSLVCDLCARTQHLLDEHEKWESDFDQEIPEAIRFGVISYPRSDQILCAEAVLQLDEIALDDLPEVRLNDRPEDEGSEARPLSELSPGQRCSAILPILLLSGDFPLIIDQPEENLDNRLIRQVIVNILASMKLRRQVIIATHNPNLPVLGDAEQCVALQAIGRDQSVVETTGDLNAATVAKYITDIMEGGREAFQYRHTIYQSHWDKPVSDE